MNSSSRETSVSFRFGKSDTRLFNGVVEQVVASSASLMQITHIWNLMINLIAQRGRYPPDVTNITQANKFTVEGEKRYWLHIAIGRGFNEDGSVDVLGSQLEEVVE
jgi:hypothetical protein